MKELEDQYRNVGKYKKTNPVLKTIDKIFLARIYMAPIWFLGLMAGVILNGGTENGMNDHWNGSAPFGDSQTLTLIGSVLLIYGAVGGLWFIGRVVYFKWRNL